MRLAIDVGNTLTKLAVFDRDELLHIEKADRLTAVIIDRLMEKYPPVNAAIIGSVKHADPEIKNYFPNDFRLLILDHTTPLPIRVDYDTPETLGVDRIAAVVAANHAYPGQNILVIESGTCITYDFIDSSGVYHGGSISPGIDLRFRALHNFTDNLPLLEPMTDNALTAKSTETSIRSGVMNGIVAELDGIISSYKRNYENLTIILSGGNLEYFDKILKNNIFAVPNIVLTGLNIILDFNVQK